MDGMGPYLLCLTYTLNPLIKHPIRGIFRSNFEAFACTVRVGGGDALFELKSYHNYFLKLGDLLCFNLRGYI